MNLSGRHWVGALAVAVFLHAGVFAVVMAKDSEPEGAQDLGENGIEIDLGMMGDVGDAAEAKEEAAPEPAEEVVEPEPEPEPVEPPPEPEPEPEPEPVVEEAPPPPPPKQEAVVEVKKEPKPEPPKPKPEPEPEPEPVEPPKEPVKKQAEASTNAAKVADEKSEAQSKQSTGSANAQTQGGSPAARQTWFSQVAAHLARHKRYPSSARRRGQEGVAKLSFVVDRNGQVLEFKLVGSSGYRSLDEAVIRMLKQAEPLPKFPAEMTQDSLSITVPVQFAIQS
ncbi:energy transducer TonB [Marinobacterium mangrovicola]|uniref:Outer membrane transport energization protein TonB n=1 Tax=Marinobacterium mangrovicola TaxID=1476959 RepID=A0A4R1G4Q3_9GAMM|nr:energy transducer TonB [Marinobacterium mangrovicola]TCK02674.1 outer membrane transport energization protein TonB [Marinobacterium mangrovicola]